MIIFAICNYIRKILNINMCNVCVNYNSLFIEQQCYIFMSLAQGSSQSRTSSREKRLNNMSTAKGNTKNLVQTIVQHLAFRETNKRN